MQIHFGLGSKGLGDQVGDEGKLQQKNCIYIYMRPQRLYTSLNKL
jgi:hypothetical protein